MFNIQCKPQTKGMYYINEKMKDRKLEISPPPLLTYFNKIPPSFSSEKIYACPSPNLTLLPSAMECIPVKQLLGKGALKTNTKLFEI